jgi:hypothetical protein
LAAYGVAGRLPILQTVGDVARFDGRLTHRATCDLVRRNA